jgi:hypothetical protein
MADRMLRNRDRMPSESAIECRRNADRIRPEYAFLGLLEEIATLLRHRSPPLCKELATLAFRNS